MDRLLTQAALLAKDNRLESLSSGFRGRRARTDVHELAVFLLILVAVVLAVWGISWFVRLQERRLRRASPLRLFASLCRAHRLRWSECWLLWRVSRTQRLRDPALLFLEPERLEVASLERRFERRRSELQEIRHRLFGRIEPPWTDQ